MWGLRIEGRIDLGVRERGEVEIQMEHDDCGEENRQNANLRLNND